jgi:hypothetical protein
MIAKKLFLSKYNDLKKQKCKMCTLQIFVTFVRIGTWSSPHGRLQEINVLVDGLLEVLGHVLPRPAVVAGEVEHEAWGQCYYHNFRRFLPNFGEKNGFFLKTFS